jgi:hypothetical protein
MSIPRGQRAAGENKEGEDASRCLGGSGEGTGPAGEDSSGFETVEGTIRHQCSTVILNEPRLFLPFPSKYLASQRCLPIGR